MSGQISRTSDTSTRTRAERDSLGRRTLELPTLERGFTSSRVLMLSLGLALSGCAGCTRRDPGMSHGQTAPQLSAATGTATGSITQREAALFQLVAETKHPSPFGISGSHNSLKALSPWLPEMRSAGISWLRGFNTSTAEQRLAEANTVGVAAVGILIWSPSGKPLTFPVDDLAAWSDHVTKLVTQCKNQVRHWEVWNEPPNFTSDKSPESYAKVVVTAYEAVKRVDPEIQVGLAAQSVNVFFLESAIDAGAKGHYDFLTVHPYETLGLVARGGEAAFLAIVPTLRAMLAAHDPERVNVPILFTELGQPVNQEHSDIEQAVTVVKAYTLSIAQGTSQIFWFEGMDGDSGPFGLLDGKGNQRPSYHALSSLTTALGLYPEYLGWIHREPGVYGFAFRDPTTHRAVLVAWAPPGVPGSLAFEGEVTSRDPIFGSETRGSRVALNNAPTLILDVPETYVEEAKANLSEPFPWNGDYSDAKEISLSAPNTEKGLHAFHSPPIRWFGSTPARDASAKSAHAYTVDPNFALYRTAPLRLSMTLRRNTEASAGFNVKYESTSGWKSAGWYTVPASDDFVTKEWVISDAEFAGKWGYHFMLDSDSTQHSGYSIQKISLSKL